MALLKKPWNRLGGHQGLIQNLVVAVDRAPSDPRTPWGLSVLQPMGRAMVGQERLVGQDGLWLLPQTGPGGCHHLCWSARGRERLGARSIVPPASVLQPGGHLSPFPISLSRQSSSRLFRRIETPDCFRLPYLPLLPLSLLSPAINVCVIYSRLHPTAPKSPTLVSHNNKAELLAKTISSSRGPYATTAEF